VASVCGHSPHFDLRIKNGAKKVRKMAAQYGVKGKTKKELCPKLDKMKEKNITPKTVDGVDPPPIPTKAYLDSKQNFPKHKILQDYGMQLRAAYGGMSPQEFPVSGKGMTNKFLKQRILDVFGDPPLEEEEKAPPLRRQNALGLPTVGDDDTASDKASDATATYDDAAASDTASVNSDDSFNTTYTTKKEKDSQSWLSPWFRKQ
jgi:hypothetical protein